MEKILSEIYPYNRQNAVEDILKQYQQKKYGTIHFLYFSMIVSQKLIELPIEERENLYYKDLYPKQKKILNNNIKNAKLSDYELSLLDANFILPDGIALQLFYYFAKLTKKISYKNTHKHLFFLKNLNGTDFIPYFLEEVKRQYGTQKISLLLYGATTEVVEKVKKKFSSQGFNIVHYQNGFSEFNRYVVEEELKKYENTVNILLVARSSVEIPLQELWTYKEYDNIKKNNLLVFTGGGIFDYITGEQNRAPKFMRIMKLERFWRLLQDPQKNKQKIKNSLLVFKYIFSYLLLKKK